jgi:uncharacterized circularly permuted ATP-grasp superfamily protein
MAREVVERYHELLTDSLAAEASEHMQAMLLERRCYFGSRPLCTVLRPNFLEPAQWAYLRRETETLMGAFRKAHRAALRRPDIREQLDLESYEEQLYPFDDGIDTPWATSRLDSFNDLEKGILQYVEYNAETPAGMAYDDQIGEAFMQLEPMKRFEKQYQVRAFPTVRSLYASLLETYHTWGGRGTPNIAIVDWGDVPTLNEHELCRELFEAEGSPTLLADPRALEYRGGKLWAGDFRIDLIYKRVLISELVLRMGIDHNPVVQAVRDRAVCISNSFSAKLMAKKASFALLSDEINHSLFDETEIAAISAHIPWTRRVQERKTIFHGAEIDLIPFIAEQRHNLVLKPNDEYGGKGVVIGWEATDDLWYETLRAALTTPYVVQERANIYYEDFPAWIDGRLDIRSRLVDSDPFIFFGRTTSGCMTRLSATTLLNVTAGGGSIVPTFIVYRRS